MKVYYISETGEEEIRAIVTGNGGCLEVRQGNVIVKTNRYITARFIKYKSEGYIEIEHNDIVFSLFQSGLLLVIKDDDIKVRIVIPQDVRKELYELFNELFNELNKTND